MVGDGITLVPRQSNLLVTHANPEKCDELQLSTFLMLEFVHVISVLSIITMMLKVLDVVHCINDVFYKLINNDNYLLYTVALDEKPLSQIAAFLSGYYKFSLFDFQDKDIFKVHYLKVCINYNESHLCCHSTLDCWICLRSFDHNEQI
jgi:hypothetical protein